jgi:alkanesulfonate monooxygenase SsuD/methylene tetrahydromethanopterin reductase-like flavin-dependent oxidoreductase (luciferase family)
VVTGPTFGKNPPNEKLHFGIVTGQHHLTWDDLLFQWGFAQNNGLDSAWGFDHFYSMYNGDQGPCFEGYTMLAGLSQHFDRLQMGLMVTGLTHRNPAILFKEAVTIDHMSGGRMILGIGAAWNEPEHEWYGIDFPSPRERVDRFGEAMEIFRRFETEEHTTFEGEYYKIKNAPFQPKPYHGHMPILIGSRGKRMMRHIAKYADQWDGRGTPEQYAESSEHLSELCREIGRDPSEIRRVLAGGGHNLASEDVFRKHVEAYHDVGVRTFLFDMPPGPIDPELQNIVDNVIPDLRRSLDKE